MDRTTRMIEILVLAFGLLASSVWANYNDEDWNSGDNDDWTYWDLDYSGDSGHPTDHNKPMQYLGTGGVGNSGYVRGPLADMEPADFHDLWTYWPAYPGELFPVDPFPYVDLSFPNAAISIFINGEPDGTGGVQSPVDLGGGEVRFFIGYYDSPEGGDVQQAFYCTKGTFAVGDDEWVKSTVFLGGDDDWLEIVREENAGKHTRPTDLYDGPQQWGFCIHPVPLNGAPCGGWLGFDEFHVIPEPATMGLLALGGVAMMRRRCTA